MKFILFLFTFLLSSYLHANLFFVGQQAMRNNDGTGWNDAFEYLQTAATVGDDIWVAQATYFPSLGNDENDSLLMSLGVEIYGGFDMTETDLSQ